MPTPIREAALAAIADRLAHDHGHGFGVAQALAGGEGVGGMQLGAVVGADGGGHTALSPARGGARP